MMEFKIDKINKDEDGNFTHQINNKLLTYRIYSINRPGRLLNFWTLRVGAYSRWALIRGWALIKFSQFQKV